MFDGSSFLFRFILTNLAGQLSQSAHLALQLPYNVLGLGRSANFLDHLYVGIPRPFGETVSKNLVCL
jgi:integrin alpha FG-GAP repeat containing protein 1